MFQIPKKIDFLFIKNNHHFLNTASHVLFNIYKCVCGLNVSLDHSATPDLISNPYLFKDSLCNWSGSALDQSNFGEGEATATASVIIIIVIIAIGRNVLSLVVGVINIFSLKFFSGISHRIARIEGFCRVRGLGVGGKLLKNLFEIGSLFAFFCIK